MHVELSNEQWAWSFGIQLGVLISERMHRAVCVLNLLIIAKMASLSGLVLWN